MTIDDRKGPLKFQRCALKCHRLVNSVWFAKSITEMKKMIVAPLINIYLLSVLKKHEALLNEAKDTKVTKKNIYNDKI